MFVRALSGLGVYSLVGPLIGGFLVGLYAFLADPNRYTLYSVLPLTILGIYYGFFPAAATGAVAGALAPNARQAAWHLAGIALFGAGLSAVAGFFHLEAAMASIVWFGLPGFFSALACELLRRRLM